MPLGGDPPTSLQGAKAAGGSSSRDMRLCALGSEWQCRADVGGSSGPGGSSLPTLKGTADL